MTVEPPAEIERLHTRLLTAGRDLVRRIGTSPAAVADGRLGCGRNLADHIYKLFRHSPIDRILGKLADRGYVPSGR